MGAIQFLKEAAYERGVNVRILTPADDLIVKTAQRWSEHGQQKEHQEQSLNQQKINIRFIEPNLQTKVSLLIADRKFSLAIELKDEFINVAAHELRTPIQPILGLSSILRSQIKDPQQQQLLDVIVRNAKRLQRLSEDILDVTKIESHNLALKIERFNLNDIISNAISDAMNQIIVKENKEQYQIRIYRFKRQKEWRSRRRRKFSSYHRSR